MKKIFIISTVFSLFLACNAFGDFAHNYPGSGASLSSAPLRENLNQLWVGSQLLSNNSLYPTINGFTVNYTGGSLCSGVTGESIYNIASGYVDFSTYPVNSVQCVSLVLSSGTYSFSVTANTYPSGIPLWTVSVGSSSLAIISDDRFWVKNSNGLPTVSLPDTFSGILKASSGVISSVTLPSDSTKYLDGTGNWSIPSGSGGSGSVTSFSSGNLSPIFITSVANATTTPALSFTLSNAGAHSYLGNNTGASGTPSYVQPAFVDLAGNIAISQMNSGTGASSSTYWRGDGTWATPAGSGTVTSVSVSSANGFGGSVANPTTTPTITILTSVNGLLKGNGTSVSAATAGTDFVTPSTTVAGHALSANVAINMTDLAQTDVTTNNVSSTAHGFVPKAPNDSTKYLDGTGAWSAPPGSTSGNLLNIQYLTSGTTYTPTSGTHTIIIEMYGGGGGGGGVTGASSNSAAAGGGSSGGYLLKKIASFSGTATYAIGTGGSGGSAGNNGSTATNSTFTYNSTTYTAYGGNGGTGMTYGTSVAIARGGGESYASLNGDSITYGTPGAYGQRLSGSVAVSGAGGSTPVGTGGQAQFAQGAGNTPQGYGAGGGGALSTGSSYSGGAGGNGIIIVWEYI